MTPDDYTAVRNRLGKMSHDELTTTAVELDPLRYEEGHNYLRKDRRDLLIEELLKLKTADQHKWRDLCYRLRIPTNEAAALTLARQSHRRSLTAVIVAFGSLVVSVLTAILK